MHKLLLTLTLLAGWCVSSMAQSDTRAHFPGGDRSFSIYWNRAFKIPMKYRLHPPENEGIVRFNVSATGAISQIQIRKSLNSELDAAAVKAVEGMRPWTPAMQNGAAVDSYIEFSYFVVQDNLGTQDASYQTRDSLGGKGGLYMDLWGGISGNTGDFGKYYNPVRAVLGIEFNYRQGPFTLGLGWDVFGFSKIKEPLIANNINFETGKKYRFEPVYVYLPLGYWFESGRKWTIAPMAGPALNLFSYTVKSTSSNRETITADSHFSFMAGLHVVKRVNISEYYSQRRNRVRYETTYVGMRLMANFINIDKAGFTPMKGAVITCAFSVSGFLERGKKIPAMR